MEIGSMPTHSNFYVNTNFILKISFIKDTEFLLRLNLNIEI